MRTFGAKCISAIMLSGWLIALPASAETSDWMTGRDSFRYANKLARDGMVVTKMECKDSGKISLDFDSALVRLTYKKNVDDTWWRITGWNNLKQIKTEYEKDGLQLVQYDSFRRQKSGLILYCTLFYRK